MGQYSAAKSKGVGRLHRADAVKRLLSRGQGDSETEETPAAPAQPQHATTHQRSSRPARRVTDIPLDDLQREYIPPLTSSKASFRSDGADHQSDQDDVAAERWNDEDHFTNKSGDPRIGTHRRTCEPNETRAESRE